MYCKHCGEEINGNQSICIKCGVLVGNGNSYCAHCGKEIAPNAVVCVSCGHQTVNIVDLQSNKTQQKKKNPKLKFTIGFAIISLLITIFLLVPHYFYSRSTYYEHYVFYYSFVEWMEGKTFIVALLVWANPIISLIGLTQEKKHIANSIIKIIVSFVSLITVVVMSAASLGIIEGLASMFFCTVIALLVQIIFSIVETVVVSIYYSSAATTQKGATATADQQFTNTNRRIFCRNCGVEMNSNQAICIKCGVAAGNGNSHCYNCGNEVMPNAAFCIHCGVAIKPTNFFDSKSTSNEYLCGNDRTTMALVCFFLGGWGIHHFIMGEKKKGIMKIVFVFVFGLSGLLALIDFIKIVTNKYEVNFDKYF